MNTKKIISITVIPILTATLLYVSSMYVEPIYTDYMNQFQSWKAFNLYYIYTFILALGIRIGLLLNRDKNKKFIFNKYALILATISFIIMILFTYLYLYNHVMQIASGTSFFLSLLFLLD